MTDRSAADSVRLALDTDIIACADALRRLPSTRGDLAAELDRGLALARSGDPGAAGILEAAVAAVDSFRHILPVDGGFALSLYVRGLLDSAYWALESRSTPPDIAARIRDAEQLIARGNEEGVAMLEAALSGPR